MEEMVFPLALTVTRRRRRRRRGEAVEVTLGELGSVSQPGHWRSTSLLTRRDAQSDIRIFQLFIPSS